MVMICGYGLVGCQGIRLRSCQCGSVRFVLWHDSRVTAAVTGVFLKYTCNCLTWECSRADGGHRALIPLHTLRPYLVCQKVDTSSAQDLESALGEVGLDGFESLPWDRLKLLLRRSHASSFLTSLGSWDEWKRRVVRDVLRETRANFHKYPRPW